MLGGIAEGIATVRGLLEGEDVLRTIAALQELGAEISKDYEGVWHIKGVGLNGLRAPKNVLDMGNSGTAARLFKLPPRNDQQKENLKKFGNIAA